MKRMHALIVGLVCSAAILAGCGKQAQPTTPPHPKLSDLQSRVQPSPPSVEAGIVVLGFDLPLEHSLARLLAATEAPGADPQAVERWRRNGLHVGVLTGEDAAAALADLPPAIRRQQSVLFASEFHVLMDIGAGVMAGHSIDLQLDEHWRRDLLAAGGRYKFLVQMTLADQQPLTLELIPHYHRPRQTVRVRSPEEQARDGRVFEQLSLQLSLPADALLVIAMVQPKLPTAEDDADQAMDLAQEIDVADTAPQRPELGPIMFTGTLQNRPVQRVLLIAASGTDI